MRPPIASPWGDQAEPDLPPTIDEMTISVGPYTTSLWVSARLSIKSQFLMPALKIMVLKIMVLVFPIFLILPIIASWRSSSTIGVAVIAMFYLFLVLALVVLTMPISILLDWLGHRGAGDTITSLHPENALNVSQNRTTKLRWRDVRAIVYWDGDVFIRGSRKGILVPREAFKSTSESESFARRARALRENTKKRGATK